MNKEKELALIREVLKIRKARKTFSNFVTYVSPPDYELTWYHKYICDKLDLFIAGDIKRLIVMLPPRHGKSQLTSRLLPAYILGRMPDAEIIASSYAIDLAARMNRDVQRIIDSAPYSRVFPDTRLFGKNIKTISGVPLRNSEIFEVVNRKGVYRASGVGTGITGMGFNFGIIDDPVKDMMQALSPTYRQNVWDWFTSTFYTRQLKDARILVTLTRWHQDDLAGRLLDLQQADDSADKWEVVCFPAVREDLHDLNDRRNVGDALWPSRYDADTLRKIKASVGSKVFTSLYQQRPTAQEGGILQRAWWRYWQSLPQRFDQQIITCDPTMTNTKGSDYCVFQCWGKLGADKYLIDQSRGQWDYPTAKRELKAFIKKHPRAAPIIVENKANGPALISELSSSVAGITPFNPRGSKESRATSHANSAAAQAEAGNIYLPLPSDHAWVAEFIDEAADFPKGKNDDMCDCFFMAILYWIEKSCGTFEENTQKSDKTSVILELLDKDW